MTRSRIVHTYKLLKILKDEFEKITVITEGTVPIPLNITNVIVKTTGIVTLPPNHRFIYRILQHIKQEIRRIRIIAKDADRGTILLFRGIYQPFSLLFARLLGHYTLLFGGGFDYRIASPVKSQKVSIYFRMTWILQILLLKIFDKIIVENSSVQTFFGLEEFNDKSTCNGHLFVEVEHFFPIKSLSSREYDIGFIGDLIQEKGIIPFISAIVSLVKQRQTRVLIVGQGVLRKYIEQIIDEQRLQDYIHLKDSIDYSEMPSIYNSMKLLVVPSLSEGLSNVVLEAMACGTPVISNPVGGIPDVVQHLKTGYLLASIQPNEISTRVDELLNNPNLLEVMSSNARKFVIQKFSVESARKNWREILDSCNRTTGE